MKAAIVLLVSLISLSLQAQEVLDTLYANDQKNIALFFPKPIRQGIVGAPHFVFNYNSEYPQYLGLLKAQPGKESNLLAITSDGQVYAYILKYAQVLPRLNYFIDKSASIGNEKPTTGQKNQAIGDTLIGQNKIDYYQRASEYLLKSKKKVLAKKDNRGVKLELQKIAYFGNEVFLVMELSNHSGINLEIEYLEVYQVGGHPVKKSSYQRLKKEVSFTFHMPESVNNGQSIRFVYVLPKFVLGANDRLLIELQEKNGNRSLSFTHK